MTEVTEVTYHCINFNDRNKFLNFSDPIVTRIIQRTLSAIAKRNITTGLFGLTLSWKLMQWYVTSVNRGSLYEKFGNKCVKILKFWRTELSYAQNKNRGKKDASFRNGYMS